MTRASTLRGSLTQIVAAMIALAGMVFVTGALVLVVREDDPPGATIMSAEEAAKAGNPVVDLGEMFIEGDLSVRAGAKLTVVNTGVAPHNLTLGGGPRTTDLNGGEATELDISLLPPANYTAYCSIEGHRAAGMEAELVITE